MAGRAGEGEAATLGGGDRGACCQQSGLESRLGGEGVPVEPSGLVDLPDPPDILVCVTAEDRLERRRLDRVVLKRLQQNRQPLLGLGVALSRMQARERRVAQDVDRRTASASSSSEAPSWARPTR